MSSSLIGKVLPCIILIVLCFVIGVQTAEDAKSSLVLVAALIGAVLMLIAGRRSWMMLFLLPPVVSVLPLPGGFQTINKAFLVAPCVLGYWLAMWTMGFVKIRWRALWVLDFFVFALIALLVAAYIKKPVTVLALGLDFDNIGGKVYIIGLLGLVYYLAMSCIPVTYAQLCKVLNWTVWVTLVCMILSTARGLVMGDAGGEEMTMVEGMQETRFGAFSSLGRYIALLLFAHFSLIRIAVNPLLLIGMLASFAAIALSGFRSAIAGLVISLTGMSIVKREFCLVLILGCFSYGVLLVLSAGGVTTSLPHGIQRVLSAFPGIEVSRAARISAEDSMEWRIVMWEWAMDPRTSYIKDYVWGDGFGISKVEMERSNRSVIRGESYSGDQEHYAERGVWHNMNISAIQSVGYVGLTVMILFMSWLCWLVFRACFAVRGTPLAVPVLIFLGPYFAIYVIFPVAAGTMEALYGYFSFAALAKLVFCVAREEGFLVPMSRREKYVPRMIQEQEERIRIPERV